MFQNPKLLLLDEATRYAECINIIFYLKTMNCLNKYLFKIDIKLDSLETFQLCLEPDGNLTNNMF